MPTTRQNILDNIKNTLASIASIREVSVDKMTAPDFATTPFPSAFIYPSTETRIDNELIGRETWSWEIAIEVWTKDDNLEDLLGQIHTAMHSDFKRGGYAIDSYRMGSEIFYIDSAYNLKGMVLTYVVLFDHVVGAP